MNSGKIYILISYIPILLTSCNVFKNSKDIQVSFKSSPNGVRVYLFGEYIGSTPLVTNITPSKNYEVQYRKEGYKNVTFTIKRMFYSDHRTHDEYKRCENNANLFFFVVPIIPLLSLYCSQFEYIEYSKSLNKS